MTTLKIQLMTSLFIAALRDLQIAVCEARSDGPGLAQRFAAGQTRVVVDEVAGLIEFALVTDAGAADWIESITADYDDPQSWGRLATMGVGPGTVQH